jgi:hypothetical protein
VPDGIQMMQTKLQLILNNPSRFTHDEHKVGSNVYCTEAADRDYEIPYVSTLVNRYTQIYRNNYSRKPSYIIGQEYCLEQLHSHVHTYVVTSL